MKPLPLAIALLTLAGCGGSRSYESINGRNAEKYIGQWTGTYGFADEEPRGTVAVTIARTTVDAKYVDVTGTITPTGGDPAPLSGAIYDSPRVNDTLVITNPGTSPTGGPNTAAFYGKARIGKNGHLLIPHDPQIGGAPEGIIFDDFDLVPAST